MTSLYAGRKSLQNDPPVEGICTALNWFEIGIVARSDGHNVIARAAYNAREKLTDERTGQVYDYRHLGEPEWEGIFHPEQAPEWVTDRGVLWNETEKREDRSTRPDTAQLARDFKIALPHELNAAQRQELIREFATELAGQGMVIDVALHRPDAKSDLRNYHAHVLATMREIGPGGFGNKVRDWNRTSRFEEWKDRWSELGSEHLERAGFPLEAQRFRVGHLSLEKQRELALGRGDHEWAKALDREPTKHMGPRATAMENRGIETRQGDLNMEVQHRNQVRGIAREIRDLYMTSADAHAFAESLPQKDMMLARVNKKDAHEYALRWGMDNTYVPQYWEGEYVVVTEQGWVYRLSNRTTADSYRDIRQFTRPLDQQDFPSLEAAQAEMKKRSLVPKVDRDELIEKMMTTAPPRRDVSEGISDPWVAQQFREQEAAHRPPPHVDPDNIRTRTSVPDGAKHLKMRGVEGERIWWAYNSTKTAEDFESSLRERSLHLARVTKEDAQDSQTRHWAAQRFGRYHAIQREGEYVVVNDRGYIHRLDERSVGHQLREIRAHMATLDATPVPTVREVQNAVHEKNLSEIDPRPWRSWAPNETGTERISGRRAQRIAERLVAGVAEAAATSVETLFAPTLTPEQKRQADVAELDRQATALLSERQRRDHERD